MKRKKVQKIFICLLMVICLISIFLSTSLGARCALSTYLAISEICAPESSQDRLDTDSPWKFIISNKSTIHSLREILEDCKCERIPRIQQNLSTTLMDPFYYVGSHYVGIEQYFEYSFLYFQYRFIFQSDDYFQWREYIDAAMNSTCDSGFILE